MEAYSIKIVCPEHGYHDNGLINHMATLYTHGHDNAGAWVCDLNGVSDVCKHTSVHPELIEKDILSYWSHLYSAIVVVCDLCECETDNREIDIFAEMSLDCAD